ncbi:DUF1207 domain-containing protein [Spirosoma spitsbergense]|uniref:DUF1207 domain-containing protein n=1 Tax=Spirosoma spitsbergense TaxID=431554 RepID=UPI000370527D|nr:DUF1207 domain-containing protein [Spirosoma spitsbergense]
MKKTVLVLFLSFFAVSWASAQQALTPAQQRQKEKIAEEIQRQQKIKAEMAQKQRDYEAKQAEKERQRQAKKAAKEGNQPQPAAEPVVNTPPVSQPDAVVNTPAEPVEKEKKVKRKKEKTPEPAPAEVTPTPTPVDTPAITTEKPAEAEEVRRVRREKKAARKSVDPRSMEPGTAVAVAPAVVRAQGEFLPKGHLFEPIILDPLEAQTYGSFLPGYWIEGQKYKGSFVPFAFGFAKPFYRRTTQPGHSEEWVLDLASFTQFEAFRDDVTNKAARRIVNTDYKVSIIYNIRRNENNYRIRVYHLSSHLGDDYIYRNKITAPSPNSVNYELLDFTYSRTVNNWRLYGGAGIVLRKSEERKLLSAQLGTFYKRPSTKATRLVGGVDVKFWQQTDFRPGIHGGIGFELGRTQNNLTFMLEGYSGFRPYSQFEQQQTSWMGIGLYLNPF